MSGRVGFAEAEHVLKAGVEVCNLVLEGEENIPGVFKEGFPFEEDVADVDDCVELMVLNIFKVLIILVVELAYLVVDGVELIDALNYLLLLELEGGADDFAMVQRVVVGAEYVEVLAEVLDKSLAKSHVDGPWFVLHDLLVLN